MEPNIDRHGAAVKKIDKFYIKKKRYAIFIELNKNILQPRCNADVWLNIEPNIDRHGAAMEKEEVIIDQLV